MLALCLGEEEAPGKSRFGEDVDGFSDTTETRPGVTVVDIGFPFELFFFVNNCFLRDGVFRSDSFFSEVVLDAETTPGEGVTIRSLVALATFATLERTE